MKKCPSPQEGHSYREGWKGISTASPIRIELLRTMAYPTHESSYAEKHAGLLSAIAAGSLRR